MCIYHLQFIILELWKNGKPKPDEISFDEQIYFRYCQSRNFGSFILLVSFCFKKANTFPTSHCPIYFAVTVFLPHPLPLNLPFKPNLESLFSCIQFFQAFCFPGLQKPPVLLLPALLHFLPYLFPCLQNLRYHMPCLYQIIMVLPCLVVMAETVFQIVPLLLLRIEPLVLYRPPSPPCLRQFLCYPLCYGQIRQEIEHCNPFPAFPSFYEIYLVPVISYPVYMVMPDLFSSQIFSPFLFFTGIRYFSSW